MSTPKIAELVIGMCIALGAAPAYAAPVPEDHACMGPWVGEGRNTGFATAWTIALTMTASPQGGRCGTIEYTNPSCGGTLERCELVGSDIHTRENYTHNQGCAPAARVIIRCEGETMRYSWIGWERVNSTLRRPAGWAPPPPAPRIVPPLPPPNQPTGRRPSVPPPPRDEDDGDVRLGFAGCSASARSAPSAWSLAPMLLLLCIRRRARRAPRRVRR